MMSPPALVMQRFARDPGLRWSTVAAHPGSAIHAGSIGRGAGARGLRSPGQGTSNVVVWPVSPSTRMPSEAIAGNRACSAATEYVTVDISALS